jgi:hypothetical protein
MQNNVLGTEVNLNRASLALAGDQYVLDQSENLAVKMALKR